MRRGILFNSLTSALIRYNKIYRMSIVTKSNAIDSFSYLPTLPTTSFSLFGNQLQSSMNYEMNLLTEEIIDHEKTNEKLFVSSSLISKQITSAMFLLRTGDINKVDEIIKDNENLIIDLIALTNEPIDNNMKLRIIIERHLESVMLHHFFKNGSLLPYSLLKFGSIEDFLSASLNFVQELPRYVIGRAIENDILSIKICHTLLSQLNGKLLKIDFRNGILRRRFDGVKYAIKTIEEILFELSTVNKIHSTNDKNDDDNTLTKKSKSDFDIVINQSLIPDSDFDHIIQYMDIYDKEREKVIKLSREIQKLSKQSIYSLHRNDINDAKYKIDNAIIIAKQTLEIVNQYPGLRVGSFSNSLEEYGEAALFINFIENNNILLKSQFQLPLTTNEYIGALSDFTGEIGRLAVIKATNREINIVKDILQFDLIIYYYLSQLCLNNFNKKLRAVQTNLKKIEDIIYELTIQSKGGKALKRELPVESKENDNYNNDE